ncbi:MAG: hypothetical protein GY749_25220 [Desulfobacteraceae bacterium]|nr:hypothetical protein [Desulfobacteraceae bacterium]
MPEILIFSLILKYLDKICLRRVFIFSSFISFNKLANFTAFESFSALILFFLCLRHGAVLILYRIKRRNSAVKISENKKKSAFIVSEYLNAKGVNTIIHEFRRFNGLD